MSNQVVVPNSKKKPMTEEERADLAKKLDDDLERFMEDMAAKRNSEQTVRKPFDFDEFCREIDSHPAFMKDLKPDANGEYSEHIQALQALKYDEDDEEDNQLTAERNKADGNKHFKLKKYRWAIDCYTNGLKAKSLDRCLNCQLYLNRATAHKYIGNNRTAIKDCASGRRFDPTNLKVVARGAECLLALGYAGDAIKWIESSRRLYTEATAAEDAEELDEDAKEAVKKQEEAVAALLEEAKKKAEEEERDKRRQRALEKLDLERKRKLLTALEERGLNFSPRLPLKRPDLFEWNMLEANLPQLPPDQQRVTFGEEGNLQWPVLIQYPEAGFTDVLTECDETTMLGTQMEPVMGPPDWDKDGKYTMDTVSFFVANEFDEYLMEVYAWTDFKSMLSYPGYQIKQGLPVIMVFTKEKIEKSFRTIGENKFVVD